MRTFEQTEATSSISNAAKSTNANIQLEKNEEQNSLFFPLFIPF